MACKPKTPADLSAREKERLKIAFYAPFKPLGLPRPSGDQIIGRGLFAHLKARGYRPREISRFRTRWIFWQPWRFPQILLEGRRILRREASRRSDLWLTYHCYYKGPDILGPWLSRRLEIPYVIFQGAYATKYRKDWRTLVGFYLNRKALVAADHVFVNKLVDHVNLKRLLPEERITYVKPGISPTAFRFDVAARREIRNRMGFGDDPVILTASMFRHGVKTQSLSYVIRACGELMKTGRAFSLLVVGDGLERRRLEALASRHLPGRAFFTGKIPRKRMYRYYSAGDLFAFPGIGESLGMVYLEAQSCGLPVVAVENGGVPEVVENGKTGFLLPLSDMPAYVNAMDLLLRDPKRRHRMGRAAAAYVRSAHDLNRNLAVMERRLLQHVGWRETWEVTRR